jgi:DNA (cytosine-5)-methyltransferase 1
MQSRLSFKPKASSSSSPSNGSSAHQLPIVSDEAVWEKDPQWCSWKCALKRFIGDMKVLELCGGTGAGYLALQKLLPIGSLQLVGHWDTDEELGQILNVIHGKSSALHLGPEQGDIMQVRTDSFPSANIAIAGPPCPPWSSMGNNNSFGDKRADVFWKVVDIVLHQANTASLGMFVLENVEALSHKRKGGELSPLKTIMDRLKAGLPENWALGAHVCSALDFGLPQRRRRVYIVGHRSDLFGDTPFSEPEHFARRYPLSEFLQHNGLHTQPSDTAQGTELQKQNLVDWKCEYTSFMTHPVNEGSLAIVDISRTPSGRTAWGSRSLNPDMVECLTASGPKLHLFSLGEGTGKLSTDRRLQGHERARLQGFPPSICTLVDNGRVHKRIFGNAMAVSVVGAVVATELVSLLATASHDAIAAWLSHDRQAVQHGAVQARALDTAISMSSSASTRQVPLKPTETSAEMPYKRRRLDKDSEHCIWFVAVALALSCIKLCVGLYVV